MERICRLTGHRLPAGGFLTESAPLSPADVLAWKLRAPGAVLYHHLVEVIASDIDLMRVINRIEHTPKTNILFGATQYLMRHGEGARLAGYYPNFSEVPLPIDGIASAFRDFVLAHEEAIVEIGQSRYTQTNECRRCVVLLPAVLMTGFDSFHLIDIGTSAGLNLAMDRYRYRWGEVDWGPDSPVELETELFGELPMLRMPGIITRIGLDLHPVDPRDRDQRIWLESLIWPEQQARRQRLGAALDLVVEVPIRFVEGDAPLTLHGVLDGLPDGDPAVIINSFSMNQFSEGQRADVESIVDRGRRRRPIARISFELFTSRNEWANLRIDLGAGWADAGQAHPHGEWVEFYARP